MEACRLSDPLSHELLRYAPVDAHRPPPLAPRWRPRHARLQQRPPPIEGLRCSRNGMQTRRPEALRSVRSGPETMARCGCDTASAPSAPSPRTARSSHETSGKSAGGPTTAGTAGSGRPARRKAPRNQRRRISILPSAGAEGHRSGFGSGGRVGRTEKYTRWRSGRSRRYRSVSGASKLSAMRTRPSR